MIEIRLPRIARQGAGCLVSMRGYARKAKLNNFELDEGFQLYHPLPTNVIVITSVVIITIIIVCITLVIIEL